MKRPRKLGQDLGYYPSQAADTDPTRRYEEA